MKRYPVSKARERLSDVLDEADRTGAVVVERRNVQYVITPKPGTKRTAKKGPILEVVDPVIAEGEWRWDWTPEGLEFRGPGKRKSS